MKFHECFAVSGISVCWIGPRPKISKRLGTVQELQTDQELQKVQQFRTVQELPIVKEHKRVLELEKNRKLRPFHELEYSTVGINLVFDNCQSLTFQDLHTD